MKKDPYQSIKHLLDPLLKIVLEEEKKSFHNDAHLWEKHEKQLRFEFEEMALSYYERIDHACDLIKKRFRLQEPAS